MLTNQRIQHVPGYGHVDLAPIVTVGELEFEPASGIAPGVGCGQAFSYHFVARYPSASFELQVQLRETPIKVILRDQAKLDEILARPAAILREEEEARSQEYRAHLEKLHHGFVNIWTLYANRP